jgi:hypothetical protein
MHSSYFYRLVLHEAHSINSEPGQLTPQAGASTVDATAITGKAANRNESAVARNRISKIQASVKIR